MAVESPTSQPSISGPDTKAIRTALGLSQTSWAQRIGTTVVTISRWENGHTNPAPYLYTKILAAACEAGVKLP